MTRFGLLSHYKTVKCVAQGISPAAFGFLRRVSAHALRMAEPQSEIDSYCSESYDVDEIDDRQDFRPEQQALTHEHHPDLLIRCPSCDVEVDISFFHCPTCGSRLIGADNDVERSSSSSSLKTESSSISFSGCPALPFIVQALLDHSYAVRGIAPDSQNVPSTGSGGV
jgi:hypothetical protein